MPAREDRPKVSLKDLTCEELKASYQVVQGAAEEKAENYR